MKLYQRIEALSRLGEYMLENATSWQQAKQAAERQNGWFIEPFVHQASTQIARQFLVKENLFSFCQQYLVPDENANPVTVGLVMAGNIPLVGFHDFMCVLLSGHHLVIKPSSKDDVLIRHLINQLWQWYPSLKSTIQFAEMLKGCHAYIATGSNNSSRYFEYYFAKYPHIIRKNRTSAAVLTGTETAEQLDGLADDIHLYFGLGCRNVSKLLVPENYNFEPLLHHLSRYNWMAEHHKYKNNYDYNLSLHILNAKYYMSTPALLLVEDKQPFSAIAQVHYEYYHGNGPLPHQLPAPDELQCLAGSTETPFGTAQNPAINQYADGVDTMDFLTNLKRPA